MIPPLMQPLQIRNCGRYVLSKYIQASKLYLDEFGDPVKVVKKEDFPINSTELKDKQVFVKMMYAPINPADVNTIQGVYGVKPTLPFTLGNEGVGRVEGVGPDVEKFKAGDWIIPATNAWGTWRTHAIDSESNLLKIPSDINPLMAATLSVNPCTAYRMLHDFVSLMKEEIVLQNGANSAVGQSVIQIARHLGLRTVNIVRNRENIEALKNELQDLGADHVLTEEEFRSSKIFKGELAPPKLILNCVSGRGVIDLVKAAADEATIVTYGGMSRQPLVVPTGPLIFKDIRFVGFWMTRWNWKNFSSPERDNMIEHLCCMVRDGALKPPKHRIVGIKDFHQALAEASDSAGFHQGKIILDLEQNNLVD